MRWAATLKRVLDLRCQGVVDPVVWSEVSCGGEYVNRGGGGSVGERAGGQMGGRASVCVARGGCSCYCSCFWRWVRGLRRVGRRMCTGFDAARPVPFGVSLRVYGARLGEGKGLVAFA